jgi:hypothetical protein
LSKKPAFIGMSDVPVLQICGTIDPMLGQYTSAIEKHLSPVRRTHLDDGQGRLGPSSA